MVSFDATLLDAMFTMTTGEILNNCGTYGGERTLIARKCQLKTENTSRQFQAATKELDMRDWIVFINNGD